MDKEVPLESTKEEERLVGWGSKVSLMYIQREGSFTEEETGSGKSIFEGGFNFAYYEARDKFDRTASENQVAIGERSERDRKVIGERAIDCSLVIYNK